MINNPTNGNPNAGGQRPPFRRSNTSSRPIRAYQKPASANPQQPIARPAHSSYPRTGGTHTAAYQQGHHQRRTLRSMVHTHAQTSTSHAAPRPVSQQPRLQPLPVKPHTSKNADGSQKMHVQKKMARMRPGGMRPRSAPPVKAGLPEVLSLPPTPADTIRIIPLGGVEEIGRNMTAIEYMDDIIVIDAGIEFSDEDTPGVDYLVPNTKYLEANQGRVRALVITHGHLDHIGAIPYIIEKLAIQKFTHANLVRF